jgi:hypothetical protein
LGVKSVKPERKRSRPPSSRASSPPVEATTRPASRSSRPRPPRPDPPQPEITVRRAPAGRETLAAIEEELAREAPIPIRPKLDTLRYEDRPAPPPSSRPPQGSAPEVITIEEGPIGRNTQAAIDEALARDSVAAWPVSTGAAAPVSTTRPSVLSAPEPAQIFEISTFVIEGDEIFGKASERSRREFVERRLLHRLPAMSMAEVVRIDVSRGGAANTVILRIWSKVGEAPTA